MMSLTTLDLSYNNLNGEVPSGGQFLAFNGTSFAGNPNLCLPRNVSCSPFMNSALPFGDSHTSSFGTSNLLITAMAPVSALLIVEWTMNDNPEIKCPWSSLLHSNCSISNVSSSIVTSTSWIIFVQRPITFFNFITKLLLFKENLSVLKFVSRCCSDYMKICFILVSFVKGLR